MLHAGLDLSRKRLDVCLLDEHGEHLDQLAVSPEVDSLKETGRPNRGDPRPAGRAVIESMTGAQMSTTPSRPRAGRSNRRRPEGEGPGAAGGEDRPIDSKVLATLSQRDLVPAIWLPDPDVREERELARFRLHLVKHRSMLKHRIHSTLINFGRPCPVTDLFGVEGRELLARLQVPSPGGGRQRLARPDRRAQGPDRRGQRPAQGRPRRHPYIPLLMSAPGVGWCSPLRSPPRSARSPAFPRPRS